jgi:signal transduction histidine kinase/CheY-like chemotaxis protein
MGQPTDSIAVQGVDGGAALAAELSSLTLQVVAAGRGDFDRAIEKLLEAVARRLNAERAYVFRFTTDGLYFSCTHDHCMPGVASLRESIRDLPTGSFPWSMSRLREGLCVEVPSLSSLPPEATAEATAMATAPLQGFLSLPLVAGGRSLGAMGFDWITRSGSWDARTVETLARLTPLLGTALDRVRMEDDLRLVEERLRSFIESTEDAVFCYELPMGVPIDLPAAEQFQRFSRASLVSCNEAYARAHGATEPGRLFGRSLAQVGAATLEQLERVFSLLGANNHRVDGVEITVPSADGLPRHVVAQALGVLEGGRLVRLWGVMRDVTRAKRVEKERHNLELQLRQAQRMESIGLLAGGIAHDFNNLLVAILNYAQLALTDMKTDPATAETDLHAIMKAGQRASTLTRQLLAFARRQPVNRRPLDLNDLVSDLLAILRRVIHESVELDFVPGHALGKIDADPGQLEQVLMNLVVNANDAIGDVGRLTIETENVIVNGSYVKVHPWARPGRYVLMTVSDTGCGMTDQVKERIFEPFFTTKGADRGTGLGLATVYGIVKQHDGMIHVYSEPDMGTTFKIYLPIVERVASTVGGKVEGVVRGGHETILVAEDNDMVQQVVRTMLERAGYRVLTASDGADAAALFDRHKDEIGLALLDAVMPVMSGRAVYHHISKQRPDLPILLASGYSTGVFPEEFLEKHQDQFVEKPYDADSLLRRIRAALDQK